MRVKRASGMGAAREKYEYDDLAALAKEHGVSLGEVREMIRNSRPEKPE